MTTRTRWETCSASWFLVLALLGACGGDHGRSADAVDAATGIDASADAEPDAAVGAAPDATPDAIADAAPDATPDAAPDAATSACPGGVPSSSLAGTFLLAIDARFSSPIISYQAAFVATVDFTAAADGTGSADVSLQALAYRTQDPIGEPLVANDVPVDACGGFRMPVRGSVPSGTTRPSVPSTVDLVLAGHLIDEHGACGTHAGTVTIVGTPLPVTGTFAMQRLDVDGTWPPLVDECPPTPAPAP